MTVATLPRLKKQHLRLLPDHLRSHPLARTIATKAKVGFDMVTGPYFLIDLDKELASLCLRYRHESQRKLKGHVRQMARAMDEGDFLCTLDPFRFDDEMKLIDGQHRLTAICQAKTDFVLRSAPVLILRDPRAYLYIDVGCPRSQHDVLRAMGVKLSPVVASALQYEMYNFSDSDRAEVTKTEKAQIAAASEFRDSAVALASGTRASVGALAGAIRCLRRSSMPELTFDFFRAAFTGDTEIDGKFEPAAQLLYRFISERRAKEGSSPAYKRKAAYMAMRAYQDFCAGVQPPVTRFYSYSPEKEFPEVQL